MHMAHMFVALRVSQRVDGPGENDFAAAAKAAVITYVESTGCEQLVHEVEASNRAKRAAQEWVQNRGASSERPRTT